MWEDNIPQLEVLASLQGQLRLGLALDALQSQDDLLGSLGLLVEDRLGLTTITALLSVVTALTLGEQRGLASLVLGDLVLGVLAALLALAVGVSGLGNVDLIAVPCQLAALPMLPKYVIVQVELVNVRGFAAGSLKDSLLCRNNSKGDDVLILSGWKQKFPSEYCHRKLVRGRSHFPAVKYCIARKTVLVRRRQTRNIR